MTKPPTVSGNDVKTYVAEHPRTVGILFALLLLLLTPGLSGVEKRRDTSGRVGEEI